MSWRDERNLGEPTDAEVEAERLENEADGAEAFAAGEPRNPPACWRADARQSWLNGYDRAKERAEEAEWERAGDTVLVVDLQLARAS